MREISHRKEDYYTRSFTVLWFCPAILFRISNIYRLIQRERERNEQVISAVKVKVKIVKFPLSTP
jgi:hypothetical protein